MTHASKNDPIEKAEMAGRKGDRLLGHLSPGDVIIPKGMVTEDLRRALASHFDVDRYTAGHEKNSVNPKTGLPEFYDDTGGGAPGSMDSGAAQAPGFGDNIDSMLGAFSALGQGDMGAAAAALGVTPDGIDSGSFSPNPTAPGWWDQIKSFLAEHATPTSMATDAANAAPGGLLDATQPPWNFPSYEIPSPPNVPMVPNNVNPLMTPTPPAYTSAFPAVGQYYGALASGDQAYANSLLGSYLTGNKNLYGR